MSCLSVIWLESSNPSPLKKNVGEHCRFLGHSCTGAMSSSLCRSSVSMYAAEGSPFKIPLPQTSPPSTLSSFVALLLPDLHSLFSVFFHQTVNSAHQGIWFSAVFPVLRARPSTLNTRLGGVLTKEGFWLERAFPLRTVSAGGIIPACRLSLINQPQDRFSAERDPVSGQILLLEGSGDRGHLSPCWCLISHFSSKFYFDKFRVHGKVTNKERPMLPTEFATCSQATTPLCLSVLDILI